MVHHVCVDCEIFNQIVCHPKEKDHKIQACGDYAEQGLRILDANYMAIIFTPKKSKGGPPI